MKLIDCSPTNSQKISWITIFCILAIRRASLDWLSWHMLFYYLPSEILFGLSDIRFILYTHAYEWLYTKHWMLFCLLFLFFFLSLSLFIVWYMRLKIPTRCDGVWTPAILFLVNLSFWAKVVHFFSSETKKDTKFDETRQRNTTMLMHIDLR